MGCINIRLNGQEFTITNGNKDSVYSSKYEALLKGFLLDGVLPEGYTVEGNVDLKGQSLFNYLNNALADIKDNTQLFRESITTKGQREFINKLVGNRSLGETDEALHKNVLYISGWGDNKNWYGFTNQRMVLLTGNALYRDKRKDSDTFATKQLVNIYGLLRAGNARVSDAINRLYKAAGQDQSADIYDRLTWLANHKLRNLISNTYVPSNLKFNPGENVTLQSVLKRNFNQVQGMYFFKDDNLYVLLSNSNSDVMKVVKDVNTNETKVVDVSRVKAVYNPILVSYQNQAYQLVNNTWYAVTNNNYTKANDEISDTLFDVFFGMKDPNTTRINMYRQDLTGNSDFDGRSLIESLHDGARIRTASGIFTKENGIFTNGDSDLDPDEKIYDIDLPQADEDLRSQLLPIEDEPQQISMNDIKVLLYDHFGIDDINPNTVSFNFKSDAPVATVELYGTTPKLKLNGNIVSDPDSYNQIKLAVNYYKYIKDHYSANQEQSPELNEEKAIVLGKNFWKDLRAFAFETGKRKDRVLAKYGDNQRVMDIFQQLTSGMDSEKNQIDEVLQANKDRLKTHSVDDAFVQELIDKGLYVTYCEL